MTRRLTPAPKHEVTPALTRPAGVDAALADSMLLTRDDLPEDYLERRHDPDAAKAAYLSCTTDPADTASGVASSDDWLFDGQSPAISETVRVYPTEAAAIDRAILPRRTSHAWSMLSTPANSTAMASR